MVGIYEQYLKFNGFCCRNYEIKYNVPLKHGILIPFHYFYARTSFIFRWCLCSEWQIVKTYVRCTNVQNRCNDKERRRKIPFLEINFEGKGKFIYEESEQSRINLYNTYFAVISSLSKSKYFVTRTKESTSSSFNELIN